MKIKIHCLYDKLVPIKEMHPHPENTNKHPEEQITRLAEILEYQGWRYPIKVSKLSGFITSGHARLSAAIKLELKEVPVNFQDYDSEEQEYADLNADNAIALWAEIDYGAINAKLPDLGPEFNIDMLGIKDFILEPADKEALCDEDEVPEKVEAKTKLGDLYILGEHRLLCGDSTDINQVEKLMDGHKADMVFTDPPYGMNLETDYSKRAGGGRTFERIINDDKMFDASFILKLFENVREIFLWGCNNYCHTIPEYWKYPWIVWEKKHEEADTTRQGAFELCWSKQNHRALIARVRWLACDNDKDVGTRTHPTQKPIALAEWFFERFGADSENIVDIFGGSGSTLIACEKTNRKCFMMELDPHYCDVIVARWEKYTGKKAVLS